MQIATKLLEKKGMVITNAENGSVGVELFKNSDMGWFDVILMDIRMPVMDGLEVTLAIRALQREDAQIVPIIAMTANAFDEELKKCISAGMSAHLGKPVEPEVLYSTLQKFLNKESRKNFNSKELMPHE